MASNKNSSSNRVEVPEARDAMDRFKMEVANELGVNLKHCAHLFTAEYEGRQI